jgi:dUTP pyrophosphatase
MVVEKINVKIKKLHPDAKVPLVGSEHAAGFDFYSVEDVILYPGETKAVSTGIAIQIPEGKACFIWDRSGMGFKGVHRFAGLIDSDYRGEFKIVLHNSNDYRFEIKKGDRIVQGVIQDYYQPKFEVVDDLENTNRGEGRFGSTGV